MSVRSRPDAHTRAAIALAQLVKSGDVNGARNYAELVLAKEEERQANVARLASLRRPREPVEVQPRTAVLPPRR